MECMSHHKVLEIFARPPRHGQSEETGDGGNLSEVGRMVAEA